ncbi:unnamed protein product [Spirodela intermedia]|uniref:RBR-type E3 ubiquitin transferase n=1 Tax=Spirodela intermedia TaxID=51605 RepID=A0A7I8IUX0_SPIIN|nr:unnamed protein product [Spirodela intermedia]CAA6661804.1 unnamed protein product [Spirodela intermedia]
MLQKLETHKTFLLPRCNIQFVFRLARDAIDAHAHLAKSTKPTVNDPQKENCAICLEDTDPNHIFEVEGCRHRFCFSCMRQHVQVKLLHGALPEACRDHGPAHSRGLHPPTEKIYCPYPRCSALMARSEAARPDRGSSSNGSRAADEPGLRKCLSCGGLFCIFCMVPWHFGISCGEYTWCHRHPRPEDEKLQYLARRSMWRRCIKCSHMIELASGCFHVACRCRYEFCYKCGGAEWKNKKATCSCPLWMVRNIVQDDQDDDESDDDWLPRIYNPRNRNLRIF